MRDGVCAAWSATIALTLSSAACAPPAGEPPDDEAMVQARKAGKSPHDAAREWFYPTAIENYFAGMDGIVDPNAGPVFQLLDKVEQQATLNTIAPRNAQGQRQPFVPTDPVETENEIFGRNAWMIWCGGNEGFWDWLANNSFGFLDLLKLVDSRTRTTRFRDGGLINEPGMAESGGPSPDEFGLWLDRPVDPRQRDWRRAYVQQAFDALRRPPPAARSGQGADGLYGGHGADEPGIPPPDIYGLSSGVVGLRLFPNPQFDEDARKKWDAARYYTDPEYYGDPDLVRPYRVGMSCAFCHASFHPLNPPRDRMKFEYWKVLKDAKFAKGDPQYQQWATERDGVYTTNGAVIAAIKRSDPARLLPDLFCFALLANFRGYFPGYSGLFLPPDGLHYLTWAILKAHTNNSAGTVTLRSADPRDPPQIDFRYFQEGNDESGADLDAVVDGIKFVRTMTAKMADLIEEEELPGTQVQTDEELRDFVRYHAWGHHASCTCPIGPRERNGVLNSHFEVHGTSGLRVVDASVFPKIPGFFIVSSVYMIGEKAADVILAAAGRRRP